jgi:iron complex outermembrane recepter protein
MRKSDNGKRPSWLALAAALGASGVAAPAVAQETPAPAEQDTIVVTGSLIRGTPEDSALPVD